MTAIVDRSALTIRPIEPGDADALVAFHEALDAESQYRRFFSTHPHLLPAEVERFTNVDHHDREALVALDGDRIVAVGRYDRIRAADATAEVAFVTALDWRHRGLASELLHRLAELAQARGVHTLFAETLGCNRPMRRVFSQAGFPMSTRFGDGVTETYLDLRPVRADLGPCSPSRPVTDD